MQRIKAAVLLVLMLMCAALFYGAFATPAFAAHSTSVNVAVVPSFESSGSGDLDPDDFPGYQFTAVDPGSVAQANDLAAYDTVILFQFCDVASHTTFTSALVAWMQTYNGKIIIWDSDSCTTQYHNLPDYSWLEALGATFQTMSAGQTGSQSGTATVVEQTKLSSSDPTSPYYIDGYTMANTTDAVGDLNVVNENTVAPLWCADMRGTNVLNYTGIALMYTKPGGLASAPEGLIIYSGFDWDYEGVQWDEPGTPIIAKLLGLQLAHGWGPAGSPEVADLNCGVPIGNLTLTPPTATSPVGTSHTVTALVTIQNLETGASSPVPGVTVTFTITSGPHQGFGGTGTTDVNGNATWTYTGTATGTDTIQATAMIGTLRTATAQKIWTPAPILTLTLTPPTATSPVGTSHTVTATATMQDATTGVVMPVQGASITFTITSGPNSGLTGSATTDQNGNATFTYTGTTAGTDVIQASGPASQKPTVQKTWTPLGNLTLTPPTATSPVGTSHTVTATATIQNTTTGVATPDSGVTVTFAITSGPHQGFGGTGTADVNGNATFTYTGTTTGTDTIQATAMIGTLRTATAQKTWTPPPIGNLTLNPPTATSPVHTSQTETAMLTLQDQQSGVISPASGVQVAFTIISGPNSGLTGNGTADQNGNATFTYTGTTTGTDTIQATAMIGTLKTATAQQTWTNIPRSGGEDPYIGLVGEDDLGKPFYFSPNNFQFMYNEYAYPFNFPATFGSIPAANQYTRVGATGSEMFRSQTLNNQAEVCDTTGTGHAPNYVDEGLRNAVTRAGNSGFYEWYIRLPKKPSGEINVVVQCGVLKPNAFAAYRYGSIELCAAETGERVGDGTCVRQLVDPGVNPVNNTALPRLTAIVYPGPFNVAFAPFHLTAFKNPSSYTLAFDPVTAAMSNDTNSQVLDGSTNARIALKACMEETVVTKLPVTGQINAMGETENDLEAGDLIGVRLDVPRQNTVDVYCHQQSARIVGIGEAP